MRHDDRSADEHEQHEAGIRDPCRHLPQRADPTLRGDVRRREKCVAHHRENRVERVGDDGLEPAVDRSLNVTGDVEETG